MLARDANADAVLDEVVHTECEGYIPVEDKPDIKCRQQFTVHFRGRIKQSS